MKIAFSNHMIEIVVNDSNRVEKVLFDGFAVDAVVVRLSREYLDCGEEEHRRYSELFFVTGDVLFDDYRRIIEKIFSRIKEVEKINASCEMLLLRSVDVVLDGKILISFVKEKNYSTRKISWEIRNTFGEIDDFFKEMIYAPITFCSLRDPKYFLVEYEYSLLYGVTEPIENEMSSEVCLGIKVCKEELPGKERVLLDEKVSSKVYPVVQVSFRHKDYIYDYEYRYYYYDTDSYDVDHSYSFGQLQLVFSTDSLNFVVESSKYTKPTKDKRLSGRSYIKLQKTRPLISEGLSFTNAFRKVINSIPYLDKESSNCVEKIKSFLSEEKEKSTEEIEEEIEPIFDGPNKVYLGSKGSLRFYLRPMGQFKYMFLDAISLRHVSILLKYTEEVLKYEV
ncbi:MAG: hypothetical protein WHS64_03050 [Fervidobacterium sp.]|uniref:hypothetical protein n=1 Tax=Fervidobacterium sp. TaxID=1871331 RepID=UPI0030AD9849